MYPDEGSLIFCPPGKSMISYRKETEKNELVARPDLLKVPEAVRLQRKQQTPGRPVRDKFPGT